VKICYLNTDLDLVAPRDLTPLGAALEEHGLVAGSVYLGDDGRWYATFETASSFDEPEPNILAMLDAIDSLDESMRAEFAACTSRVFDIGYECGSEPRTFMQGLAAHVLNRMAAAGASLMITLYPPAEPGAPK
jgi:hypothetical protein